MHLERSRFPFERSHLSHAVRFRVSFTPLLVIHVILGVDLVFVAAQLPLESLSHVLRFLLALSNSDDLRKLLVESKHFGRLGAVHMPLLSRIALI